MIPQPSFAGNDRIRDLENYGYQQGVFLGNSGYVRVAVSPDEVKVAYLRTQLPQGRTGRPPQRRSRPRVHDPAGRSSKVRACSRTISADPVILSAAKNLALAGADEILRYAQDDIPGCCAEDDLPGRVWKRRPAHLQPPGPQS